MGGYDNCMKVWLININLLKSWPYELQKLSEHNKYVGTID